jgi:ATP-dependent RNA helicase DDX42
MHLARVRAFDSSGNCLHGDMLQFERDKAIRDFKNDKYPILVATDVAGKKSSTHIFFLLHAFA